MIDKARAIELREQGWTYKEIASELGCSENWCKINLKGIEKNTQEKDALDKAIKIATSPTGITHKEISDLVHTIHPKEDIDMTNKAIDRFKKVIRKDPKAVIRPYWMHPDAPRESFNLVLGSVDVVMDKINEEINYIRQQLDYDRSYENSLRHAIVKMLLGSDMLPEGIINHCTTLENIVDKLESASV